MGKKNITEKISNLCYRALRQIVKQCYPKITLEGLENLPKEPCIFVGNHSQMNGPIIGELYLPVKCSIWCAGEMMHLRQVPAYAYQDFWSQKPMGIRWFYRILSYLIAPLSVCIFNQAHTIAVNRDHGILSTFRETVKRLEAGESVVIFPEGSEKYNAIINHFQDGFVDVASLYYKRSGKQLSFVPMYIAPRLKKVYFGKPVGFCASQPREAERQRISSWLMQEITNIATALPLHTVVPYQNIPKKEYPTNIPVR